MISNRSSHTTQNIIVRKEPVFSFYEGQGLRVRNPHDLRHTYATILLMAHQSPAYVQKQLGHSSISITVDTYGHWISGEGRRGLENALLGLYEKSIKTHTAQSGFSK